MKKDAVKRLIMLISGIIITAVGISNFTLPNKIVGGGVSGVSTLLYHTVGIQPGVSNAVINVLLLAVGFKVLGKKFVFSTLAASLLLSGFVQVFSYLPPVTENVALASVFGGAVYGLGVGLALASEGSTGGTDILGRLLQHKFKYLPIGKLIMVVDGVVILMSLIAFGKMELTLYGVVTLVIYNDKMKYCRES